MRMTDWRTEKVIDLQRAGILLVEDGNHGEYRPRPGEFVDQGVVFIRAADINDGQVLFESASKISEIARKRITKGIGSPGDVLLSHKGTVGKLAMVPEDAPPFVCSPQTTFWRTLNSDVLDRRYLYSFMRSPLFRAQLGTRASETDMAPYVSLTSQRALFVAIPPIGYQRAIAHILGTLDDKIELNRRMNETLEAMARAIFKSWFVDFDPVRAKMSGEPPESICNRLGLTPELLDLFPDRLHDSELGEVPEGWEVKGVDNIANYLNGLALQKYPPGDGDWLPVIKIAQLRAGHTAGADRASTELPGEYVVKNGDVLFSWSGSLLVKIWCGGRGALNQHLFKVTSDLYPKWFYYLWTKYHLLMFRAIASDKATTMGHIKRKNLSEAKALIPGSELLNGMTGIFQPLVEQSIQKKLESKMIEKVRDALIPKLISGELSVPGSGDA